MGWTRVQANGKVRAHWSEEGKLKGRLFKSELAAETFLRQTEGAAYVPPNMRGRGTQNRQKTECPFGHPYDEHNTGRQSDGRRYCKACKAARAISYYHIAVAPDPDKRNAPRKRLCRDCKHEGLQIQATVRTRERIGDKMVTYAACDKHRRGRPGG